MHLGITSYADSPTESPMSLAQAKLHLRVDINDDDELIGQLVDAVTLKAEAHCSAAFVPRSYSMWLGAFPGYGSGVFGPGLDGEETPSRFGGSSQSRYPSAICLPVHPLISVSAITYLDTDNVEQTLATSKYVVVTNRRQPMIVPATGYPWPATYDHPEAVRVNFRAGFEGGCPADAVIGMKLWLTHLYENRGETDGAAPASAKFWLNKYTLWPL